MKKIFLYQFIVCLFLAGCTQVKNGIYSDMFHSSYDYSVSISYLDDDNVQNPFIQPFELYKGAYQLGAKGIWFPTVGGVDGFTQKPYQKLKLDWFEVKDGVPKRFSKVIDMTLPKQFTPERGREIGFYFYKGEVIVTYEYQSDPQKGRYSENFDDYKEIYSNGTPAELYDFKIYMDQHPNGTAEKFLEYIKDKSHLIQPEITKEYVKSNKVAIPKINSDSLHNADKSMVYCDTSDARDDQELLRRLSSANYKYRMMGEIIDPYGNIVTDVTILSRKYQYAKAAAVNQEKFFVKDGKFNFSSNIVFSWILSIKKEQYYDTDIEIRIPDLTSNLDMGTVIMDGNVLVKRVKAILYPHGNLNHDLVTVSKNVFKYSETDNVKKFLGIMLPYEDSAKQKELLVTGEAELPNNLIYIVPGRDEMGIYDGTIRLKTTADDGGFLPLKYDGNHFFRNMQEAPRKGTYIPELTIGGDWLTNSIKFGHVPVIAEDDTAYEPLSYIVFYFKGVGFYGKGLIKPLEPESWINKNSASLKIFLYINRNRNVCNTNCWLNNDW